MPAPIRRPVPSFVLVTLVLGSGMSLGACADPAGDPLAGLTLVGEDASENPLADLGDDWMRRFDGGDVAFENVFLPSQGLGPVYIRHSCASCHADDARGPGAVRKMVVVDADGRTAASDQALLSYGHTVRPQVAGGGEGAQGIVAVERDDVLLTTRFGPAVFGRGYLEAIADAEIERMEAEQALRDDDIHGRVQRVPYQSEKNPDERFHTHAPGEPDLVGRFGLKARIATIDDFVADAYQGDMGITSPLRPDELPNPVAPDDEAPGLDIDAETVNLTADYVRLLRIPTRRDAARDAEAGELFEQVRCGVCHVPSLRTRDDYPIEMLAGVEAPVYTDLLLHDMGPNFSDGLGEYAAGGSDWKTSPLMGLRLLRSYLHDGRAASIEEAIEMHGDEGSEAAESVDLYDALPDEERRALLDFVSAL